jgi:dihydrofolate reductase
MRELILFMHISLDGYVAAAEKTSQPTAGGDSGSEDDGTVDDQGIMDTVVPKLTSGSDTLLLGRLVADELLGYWLTAETKYPDLSSGYRAYARWATGAHKAVISNTEERLPWDNSELLLVKNDEDMVRTVSALKRQPGKNIVFHGGVRTAQNLARLNLIDEYQLVVEPEALGDGKPLFRNLTDKLKLNLVEATALKAGDVFLRYRPATVSKA